MAELAGRSMVIKISATDANYTEMNGVDNSTLKQMCDMLDISCYGNEYKRRIAGMKDGNLNLSGNLDTVDAPQLLLVPGDFVWIEILPDGTNGKKAKFLIEDFNQSAPTEGKQTFSSTMHLCGTALVVVP